MVGAKNKNNKATLEEEEGGGGGGKSQNPLFAKQSCSKNSYTDE